MRNEFNDKNSNKKRGAIGREDMGGSSRWLVTMMLALTLCLMGVPASAIALTSDYAIPSGNTAAQAADGTQASSQSSAPFSLANLFGQASQQTRKRTLERSFEDVNGHAYTVWTSFDEDANVPENAELSVREITRELTKEEQKKEANKDRPFDFEKFMGKDEMADRMAVLSKCFGTEGSFVYFTRLLQIEFVSDGTVIDPGVMVDVTIETNAVAPALSDGLGAAVFVNAPKDTKAEFMTRSGQTAIILETQNHTGDKDVQTHKSPADENKAKVSFKANKFGEFALTGISETRFTQEAAGSVIEVLGPRTMTVEPVSANVADAGDNFIGALSAKTEPVREFGTTLWARIAKDSPRDTGYNLVAKALHEGKVTGESRVLSYDAPVPFTAADGFALFAVENANQAPPSDAEDTHEAQPTPDEEAVGESSEETGEEPEAGDQPATDEGMADETSEEAAPAIEDGGESPTDDDAPAPVDQAPANDRIVLTQSALSSDGTAYNITVTLDGESGIGEDATLQIREITGDESSVYEEKTEQALQDGQRLSYLKVFDITILDAYGNEVEPETPASVSITIINAPSLSNTSVMHFDGDEEPEVIEPDVSKNIISSTFKFETDTFSVYALAGYTVDFHWNGYCFSIAGQDSIFLSELLQQLSVTEAALDDIESVTFSDPSLVNVEKKGVDWLLESLAPFHTEEKLTLNLKNGGSIEIKVTDDPDVTGWNQYPIGGQFTEDENPTILYWKLEGNCLYIHCNATFKQSVIRNKDTNPPSILGGYQSQPWYNQRSQIQRAVVTGTMSAIPARTFQNANNLTEVDMTGASNITAIGPHAFYNSSDANGKITSLLWPSNISSTLTTVYGAFYFVKAEVFPEGGFSNITLLGDMSASDSIGAFHNATGMTRVNLSGSSELTTIPRYAFNGCVNVASVDLSGCTSLTTIHSEAFKSCSNITSVDISGSGLSAISGFNPSAGVLKTLTAQDCLALTTLNLSNNYAKLETLDLRGCSNLNLLTLRSSLSTPLALHVSNTFARNNLANSYPNSDKLTIYYDGSYSEWLDNGFGEVVNDKWGNVNVFFSTKIQLTNDSGLLYYHDGSKYMAAAFDTIADAYAQLGNLYVRNGNDYTANGNNPVNLEMCVNEYAINDAEAFDWTSPVPVTITSKSGSSCVFMPGDEFTGTHLLNIDGSNVSLQRVIFDGNGTDGAVDVKSGELTLGEGLLVRNSQSASGAVHIADGVTLTVKDDATVIGANIAVYVGGQASQVHFAGSPQIAANTVNIYVPETVADTSEIFTVDSPLASALIGIYIANDDPGSSLYSGAVFATTAEDGASIETLAGFINDRMVDGNGTHLQGWPVTRNIAGDVIWATPIQVKFVEMDPRGNFRPLPSMTDSAFALNGTTWSNSSTMLDALDMAEMPPVSGDCFFYYYGIGADSAADISSLGDYGKLDDFYLKITDDGLIYSPDGTGEGTVVPDANTVFVVYSPTAPAGSGTLTIRNVSEYRFEISSITVWSKPPAGQSAEESTVSMIVKDPDGVLREHDSIEIEEKNSAAAAASITLLNCANKNFRLSGGCNSDVIPAEFEIEFNISNPSKSVFLMGDDARHFPSTGYDVIGGTLINNTQAVNIIINAQAPKEVYVSKTWIDNTVPDGVDQSDGNPSIDVRFLDEDGYSVKVRADLNDAPGVEVNNDEATVTLNRIDDEWPDSWPVFVAETAVFVQESPITGYTHAGGAIDPDTSRATIVNEKAVCKIGNILFSTLNSALDYAVANGISNPEIEMLLDYTMPPEDALSIPNGYTVTITTALSGEDNCYEGDGVATITRADNFVNGYMFNNEYEGSTLIFSDITLDGNSVPANKAMVFNAGNLEILQGVEKTTLKGANCSLNGGAIESRSEASASTLATVTLIGAYLTGNHAANGGAIYVADGDLMVYDSTIGGNGSLGNTAISGGAIYYKAAGTFSIENSEILGNSAAMNNENNGGNGGGLYIESGTVIISTNAKVKGNSAVDGGGIYATGGVINPKGSGAIVGNEASRNGGGIFTGNASVIIETDDENGQAGVLSNTAANTGGGIYARTGIVSLPSGYIKGNSSANGGAIYSDTGRVSISGGTITENTTTDGSVVLIAYGTADMMEGTITGNTATGGGAVGVGNFGARLNLSGKIYIRGNHSTDDEMYECNVYLDRDTDGIINTTGFDSDADVGIYVPGDMEEQLFKNRGQVGASFGIFTGPDNLSTFKNDRQTSLLAMGEEDTRRIIWSGTIQLQFRRLDSFAGGFPPSTSGTTIWPVYNDPDQFEDYYPPSSRNAASSFAENLYSQYSTRLSQTNAFAGAFIDDPDITASYADYITDINWNNITSQWECVKRDGTVIPLGIEDDRKKLIFYYAEPAYVTIENNNDQDFSLRIDSFTLPGLGQQASLQDGYGFVVARNGVSQNSLKPIVASDLNLKNGETRKLMFPGGVNQPYVMSAQFTTANGTPIPSAHEIDITRTYVQNNTIKDMDSVIPAADVIAGFELGTENDAYPSRTYAKTLNIKGGTHEIVFGSRKRICKIVADDIAGVPEDAYAEKIRIGTSNRYEYLFSNVRQAISFGNTYMGQDDLIKIELLIDYLIPGSDSISLTPGYKFMFTTALVDETEGDHHYEGEGRASISRDTNNLSSLLAASSMVSGTELHVSKLDFDGKNFSGSIDGGVVATKNCKIVIDHANFKNCRANNGGAIFADYTIARNSEGHTNYYYIADPDDTEIPVQATNALVDISYAKFDNCYSQVNVGDRIGGGAIHTAARFLKVDNCQFNNCDSKDQGGGIFQRIETWGDPNSRAEITNSIFYACRGAAAGAVELDPAYALVTGCRFEHCSARARNAGAVNIWALGNENFNAATEALVEDCVFNDCTIAITSQGNNGGGLRLTTKVSTVRNCTFDNVSAKHGGAIANTNTNGYSLDVSNCRIGEVGGASATEYGGGIYTLSEHFTVTDTLINNCYAGLHGGGIYQVETSAGTFTDIDNCTITNCRCGMANANNFKDIGGAGIHSRTSGLTITNSEISDNSAEGSGGGICYIPSNNGKTTLDNTRVLSNSTDKLGGGIYCTGGELWLKNSTYIRNNKLTTDEVINAAGVYMPYAGFKLVIGDEARGEVPDDTSINANTTANGTASNFKMRVNSNTAPGTRNPDSSVEVRCNLNGTIGVINPMTRGIQFGTSTKAWPAGFSDTAYVFSADDKSDENYLYGISDRTDTNGYKLIWAGRPVCKVTSQDGSLLYLRPGVASGLRPAVFDKLNDTTNTNSNGVFTSAFNLLRHTALNDAANPILFYADGTPYLDTTYYVRMLVENYTATTAITTNKNSSIAKNNGKIVFTTASRSDADQFAYRGKPGTTATVKAGTNITGTFMTAKVNMDFVNIALDGNNTGTHYMRLLLMNDNANMTVRLGNKSSLANAYFQADGAGGAGVRVDSGTLVIDGATISNCKAETTTGNASNGGGVSTGNNGYVNFVGGKISGCSADKGGGIFIGSRRLEMSNAEIKGNYASTSGGGIAVGSSGAVLVFSGEVTVSDNKMGNNVTCNVQLDYDQNTIIQCTDITGGDIGIYVPDGPALYDKHGVLDTTFGTYADNTDVVHLRTFVSDRDGYKGGYKLSNPGLIFWVKDFSLKVTKTVNSPWDSDKNDEFEFIVILSGKTVEGVPAERISGTYGGMFFTNGVATRFKLRDGQSKQANDLPEGLDYIVQENLSASQRDYYVVKPSVSQTGYIGENTASANPETRYVSHKSFLNLHKAGARTVILRKINVDGDSLAGAKFNVYRGFSDSPFVINHKSLANLESNVQGIYWSGSIPYGTYYLKENTAPAGYESNTGKWFCLIVDEKGSYMSLDGYFGTGSTIRARAITAKAAALRDASAVRQEAYSSESTP